MPGVELALGATFCGGIADTLTKKTIAHSGRYKAIAYNSIVFIALLVAAALILGVPFVFPPELLPAYIVQSIVGAAAGAAFFKAFESGKASILAPLGSLYVLIVVFLGVTVFGESLGASQFAGAALVLISAFVLAFEDIGSFKLEKGVFYLILTVIGWGYYYSFIKIFIPAMGPFMTTVVLESGVAFFVIAYYLAKGKDLSPPPSSQAPLIAVRSFIIFLGALLYTYAVAGIGVALTSVIVAGTPLVSVPASHLLLGEKLSAHKYAAIVLIVIGLVMVLV